MASGVETVGFFASLSFIGWLGVGVWVSFFVLMVVKQDWFFHFDDRFPKIEAFERFGYVPETRYIFMIIRLIAIGMLFYIVGMFMTFVK